MGQIHSLCALCSSRIKMYRLFNCYLLGSVAPFSPDLLFLRQPPQKLSCDCQEETQDCRYWSHSSSERKGLSAHSITTIAILIMF